MLPFSLKVCYKYTSLKVQMKPVRISTVRRGGLPFILPQPGPVPSSLRYRRAGNWTHMSVGSICFNNLDLKGAFFSVKWHHSPTRLEIQRPPSTPPKHTLPPQLSCSFKQKLMLMGGLVATLRTIILSRISRFGNPWWKPVTGEVICPLSKLRQTRRTGTTVVPIK